VALHLLPNRNKGVHKLVSGGLGSIPRNNRFYNLSNCPIEMTEKDEKNGRKIHCIVV